jgi:hypothetical protein
MNVLLFEMKISKSINYSTNKHVSKLPSYYGIYEYSLLGKAVVVKSPLPSMIGQHGFLGTHPSQVEA